MRGTEDEIDFKPVVKLFNPCGAATWLLTELDPDEPDIAFGLCDLGMQCAELGSVSISELESYRGRLGLGIERDRHWTPKKTPYGLCPRSVGPREDQRMIGPAETYRTIWEGIALQIIWSPRWVELPDLRQKSPSLSPRYRRGNVCSERPRP